MDRNSRFEGKVAFVTGAGNGIGRPTAVAFAHEGARLPHRWIAIPWRDSAVGKETSMTARFLAMYETPTDIDAFERHYQEVHVPLAKRLPGLRSYTISRGIHAVRGDTTYYMVAMLDWDDLEALRAAFASTVGQETAADVANLTALAPTVSMTFEVVEV